MTNDSIKKLNLDKNLLSTRNAILDRIHSDWDIVIAIDGEEGVGKSNFGILLGYLIDHNFDLEGNVAYLPSPQQVEDKFKALKHHQCFVVDEAIKALYKLQFMSKFQTRVNEMYATERWQNKVTLLLLPRFTDLNEYFRNHRVKFWIHVVDRGVAVAFAKDEVNIFTSDKWHMAEEYKRIQKTIRGRPFATFTTEQKIEVYKKSQHFMFAFNFPKLPDEIEEVYVQKKQEYRAMPETKESERKQISSIVLKLFENGTSLEDIVKITSRPMSTVQTIIRYNKPDEYKEIMHKRHPNNQHFVKH